MFLYTRLLDVTQPVTTSWVEIRPVDYTFCLSDGPVSGDGADSWSGLRLNGFPVLSKQELAEFAERVKTCSDLAKDRVVVIHAELWDEEQTKNHLSREVAKLGWSIKA